VRVRPRERAHLRGQRLEIERSIAAAVAAASSLSDVRCGRRPSRTSVSTVTFQATSPACGR
jgi:hypothetical protein